MATKRKYKRHAHHYDGFDFSQVMQFMKDNPELMQMAGSMLANQGGGQQQQQQAQQPVDKGVTGQKQTWSGDSSTMFSNEVAGIANMIGALSDKGNIPVEEAIGLPGSYYSCGGKLYGGGGFFGANMGGGQGSAMGYVNAAFDGVGNILSQANGVDTKSYEKKVRTFGKQDIAASSNDELLNSWQSRRELNHVDKYDITGGNVASEVLGRLNQNINAANKGFMTTGNWVGAVIGGATDLIGQGINIFRTAKNIKRLNNAIDVANVRQDKTRNDKAANLHSNATNNILANYNAFGGPLGYGYPIMGASFYDIAKDNAYAKQMQATTKNGTSFTPSYNTIGSEFADGGGIHIAPSKRGTFTAAAKKHGKSVQAFASQVLANPDNYSPAMRKKANFARNAAKWHADGGFLMSDEFNNGVTLVDQGGTHENNPHEGVQMGIAPDGAPNLVEEGEAIFNDYVFSNRLKVPKEVRNKYKLRGPKDMTFAEAFREAQKESEERPNDPISQDGLENIAMVLARTQEAVRGYEKSHKKALGGHKYDGLTDNWTPEEYYRVYGVWPEEYAPVQNWTAEGAARVAGTDVTKGPEIAGTVQTTSAPEINDVDTKGSTKGGGMNALRYADVFANAGAVLSDWLGMTNTPTEFDYIPGFQAVSYNPLGNYIPVTHFDTRYAANRAAQQAAATRAAIMQSTAPSRWANLLAADYNAQIANGELLRNAAMDDYNMMVQREQFNRATNQANSEMGLKAAIANQEARLKYGQAALQQAKMNDDASTLASSARAQNLGNLAESISNIGRESTDREQTDMLIESGAFGTISQKPYWWSDKKWKEYQENHKACGGKIRKRKKGLTY